MSGQRLLYKETGSFQYANEYPSTLTVIVRPINEMGASVR